MGRRPQGRADVSERREDDRAAAGAATLKLDRASRDRVDDGVGRYGNEAGLSGQLRCSTASINCRNRYTLGRRPQDRFAPISAQTTSVTGEFALPGRIVFGRTPARESWSPPTVE